MALSVTGAALEQERGLRPRSAVGQAADRALSVPNRVERASTWAHYQEAFSFPHDRLATESYLHDIFYQRLPLRLPRAGHAFGIVLERWLRTQRAMDGADAGVAALNLRQLGRPFLEWLHSARLRGEGHEPSRVARQLAAEFSAGGAYSPQVVCLTSPTSLASGHVLLVQGVELVGPEVWAVHAFDPSGPENGGTRGGQASGWLCIDAASNRWRYRMGDGTWWEGSAGGGGELLAVPAAVLRQPSTPFVSDARDAAAPGAARALVMVEGDARSVELTDGAGRTFFDPGAVSGFDPNDPGCLGGLGGRPPVTRWTAFGGMRGGMHLPEAYLTELRTGERLHHRLRGERQGRYVYTVLQSQGCAIVQGACGEGGVAFSLEGAGRVPRLRVESDRRQTVEVVFSVMAEAARRLTVRVAEIGLWPASHLQLEMDVHARALTITNGGQPTQFDISMEVWSPGSVRRESVSRRLLSAGRRMIASPGAVDEAS